MIQRTWRDEKSTWLFVYWLTVWRSDTSLAPLRVPVWADSGSVTDISAYTYLSRCTHPAITQVFLLLISFLNPNAIARSSAKEQQDADRIQQPPCILSDHVGSQLVRLRFLPANHGHRVAAPRSSASPFQHNELTLETWRAH